MYVCVCQRKKGRDREKERGREKKGEREERDGEREGERRNRRHAGVMACLCRLEDNILDDVLSQMWGPEIQLQCIRKLF